MRKLITLLFSFTFLFGQIEDAWDNSNFGINDTLFVGKYISADSSGMMLDSLFVDNLGDRVILVSTHTSFTYNDVDAAVNVADSGDVILVLPGLYTGFIDADVKDLTIKSLEGPERTTLATTITGGAGIELAANGVVLEGFTLTGDAAGSIIQVSNNPTGVIVQNCIINSTGSATFGYSISTSGASDPIVRNNRFLTNSGDGAMWINKTVDHMQIYDNVFLGRDKASGYAIQSAGFTNWFIYRNEIRAEDPWVGGFASGIFMHTATSGPAASDSAYIYDNTIGDCDKAVRLGHTSMTAAVDDIFVYNNNIYNSTTGVWISSDAQNDPATFIVERNVYFDNTADITNNHSTALAPAIHILQGSIAADVAPSTEAADGTRYWEYVVTASDEPATSGEVNAAYYEYTVTGGANNTFTLNALEGVARSAFADEAGTMRGVYGRFYIVPGASNTLRTGIGGEFSARAGFSGNEITAESGTAFVGSRIWMAPYFTGGSLSNVNNHHGLWLYNEHPTNAVTNAIYVDNIGAGGGWTNGLNFSNSVIGTSELIGSQGETWENVTTDGIWRTDGAIALATFIDITPTASQTYAEGRIYYDSDDHTLVIFNDESEVAMNVGEEIYKRVRNNSGSDIGDGLPVYISGAVGQLPTIALADASATGTAKFAGLTTHLIENNSNGYVTIFGIVRGLDTDGSPFGESWSDGDMIYVSETTGELTNVRPSAAYVVVVGHVDYSHTSAGRLQVHPSMEWAPDYRLGDLYVGGVAGVKLSAADGVLTFLGEGDGNDLNLIWDYDNHATATTIGVSSGAATLIDWGSIGHTSTGGWTTGDITISNADPVLNYIDTDGADNDINLTIANDLTVTTSGAEDATITIQSMVDGTMRDMIVNVVEADLTFTSYKGSVVFKPANTTALTLSSSTATVASITTWDMGTAVAIDFDSAPTFTSNNGLFTFTSTAGLQANIIGIGTAPIAGNHLEFPTAGVVSWNNTDKFTHSANTMTVSGFTTWDNGAIATVDYSQLVNIGVGGTAYTIEADNDVLLANKVGIGITPAVKSHVFNAGEFFTLLDDGTNSQHITTRLQANSVRIHYVNELRLVEQTYANRGTGTGDVSQFTFKEGNFGINTITFGTNLDAGLAIGNGTAATAVLANGVQMWSADFAGGDTRLFLMTEAGTDVLSFGNGTISQSTGQLDISTLAGDGNIVLTPNGTGVVDIASGALNIGGAQIDSDDLSDVVSIGMLDENETMLQEWYTTTTVGITAVNPGVQGDGLLISSLNQITVVGVAADAVTIQAAVAGLHVYIVNDDAVDALEIWPTSGDDLGAGVDTAINLAAGATLHVAAIDGTTWKTF